MDPEKLLYAESHEWVAIEGETATVGISAFAVEQLNDLVYLDLGEPGKTVSPQDEFGEIESVKAVNSIYSPVAGEIVDVNSDLPENLDWLHESPYEKGWMVKIKLSSQEGVDQLMDAAAYQKQCAESG